MSPFCEQVITQTSAWGQRGLRPGHVMTSMGSFASARRGVILGTAVAVVLVAGLSLAVGSIVRGSPIRVAGSIGQSTGCPQSCYFGPARNWVRIRQLALPWRTIQATPDSSGDFSVSIAPGRYEVSVAGCKTYDWPGHKTPEFELHADGSVDSDGFAALHWLVDAAGNCQSIPLGTALSSAS
jgi:hypothetical protein